MNNRKERDASSLRETTPRYLRIRDAAALYSVSPDFLRRNKAIRKVTLGKRLVRIDATHLEQYFKEREN